MNKISIFIMILIFSQAIQDLPEFKLANETAEKLVEETKSVLMKAMAESGPEGAIEECSRIALNIAKEKERDGWQVRRVSVKYRNPADKPDKYEEGILKEFEALRQKNELTSETLKAEVIQEGDKKFLRYMKPIIIPGNMCLKCHGKETDINPDIQKKLKQLYPDDKATGYSTGDLRGAVSIKIPLDR
jgi:hypothetical protein